MQKMGMDELTLRDLESMPRPQLLQSLQQIASFFPTPLNYTQLNALSEFDLRQLVNRARRKFQGMGY